MSNINLQRDDRDEAIQVLKPHDATTAIGTSSGASVRLTLPTGSKVVDVSTSAGVHWQFGDLNVTATSSNKYQNGLASYSVPSSATHLAFIAATGVASAIVSVTRLY